MDSHATMDKATEEWYFCTGRVKMLEAGKLMSAAQCSSVQLSEVK
jgi:hypothetical protein